MSLHESGDGSGGVELLEDCWFFGNLLQTRSRSRMLRSFSDPCSSLNNTGNSYEETYESIRKLESAPPRDRAMAMSERRSSNGKSSSRNSLARAPSLPISFEKDRDRDFHDEEEREFSMGKLIRQASMNYSDSKPPRKISPKSITPSSSLTRQKSRRKPEAESAKPAVNKLKTQKSLKDMAEIHELQGFKDLGFDLDEEEIIRPSIVNIEKKSVDECEEKRAPRPSRPEAPPVPRWGGKRSNEDMKAQIKFWARAVASNVRQEC